MLVIVPAVVLLGLGVLVGVVIGRGSDSGKSDTAVLSSVPASAIGDPSRGEQIWTAKSCSLCHSIDGKGGSDAPPLDFMRGKQSVRDIAGMSGTIWDHVPKMLPAFREEGIPFPSISRAEMADLIAYLHGGPPPAK